MNMPRCVNTAVLAQVTLALLFVQSPFRSELLGFMFVLLPCDLLNRHALKIII